MQRGRRATEVEEPARADIDIMREGREWPIRSLSRG